MVLFENSTQSLVNIASLIGIVHNPPKFSSQNTNYDPIFHHIPLLPSCPFLLLVGFSATRCQYSSCREELRLGPHQNLHIISNRNASGNAAHLQARHALLHPLTAALTRCMPQTHRQRITSCQKQSGDYPNQAVRICSGEESASLIRSLLGMLRT